jgi:hypothetical protein
MPNSFDPNFSPPNTQEFFAIDSDAAMQAVADLSLENDLLISTPLQKYMASMIKKPKAEALKMPELPIIPEANELDGSKRLWKTRYNLLEEKYILLLKDNHLEQSTSTHFEKKFDEAAKQLITMNNELQKLKNSMVDMELVTKRLDQFITEFNLPLPKQVGTGNMEKRLEAFFGALWTRCRTEETEDEVAS